MNLEDKKNKKYNKNNKTLLSGHEIRFGLTSASLPGKPLRSIQGKQARLAPDQLPEISIIIPVYNEEESVDLLYKALTPVMEKLGRSYEVILIDDGSMDRSYAKMQKIHQINSYYKIIRLRRNFGQTQAMRAGFDHAQGSIVITMDADLQNDPADIPAMLDKMKEDYDIVSGWRKDRKDRLLSRRMPSVIANRMISALFNVRLHDFGCTLKAYRKDILDNIELYGEMHRYIPAVASWMGVRVAEIGVNHHPRKYGKAKYGISRTIRVILDLVTIKFLLTYSKKPMQIFGLLGFISTLAGFIMTTWLIVQRIFFDQPLSTRPLFILSIFILLLGIQLITMGLLGEIIMRTYHEGTGKPTYVIKEILDK